MNFVLLFLIDFLVQIYSFCIKMCDVIIFLLLCVFIHFNQLILICTAKPKMMVSKSWSNVWL